MIVETETQFYKLLDFDRIKKEPVRKRKGETLGFIAQDKWMRVLYTSRVAFFDIDLVPGCRGLEAVNELHCVAEKDERLGFRVYSTAGGLRYIYTSGLLDPCSVDTTLLMLRLRADPKYLKICLQTKHFAARLNPKPERCEDGQKYAVTAFRATVGNPEMIPECKHIAEMHDAETGAFEALPLA